MDYNAQLKLQAYLDGELPEPEAREVARWLAEDQQAVLLLAELRNTRQALAGFENGRTLPESREFFWSKIAREIEAHPETAPVSPRPSRFASWQRFLLPAGAAAALAVAILAGLNAESGGSGSEMAVADPGAMTYHDFASRTTLVWLSYPAENELADNDATGTVP